MLSAFMVWLQRRYENREDGAAKWEALIATMDQPPVTATMSEPASGDVNTAAVLAHLAAAGEG